MAHETATEGPPDPDTLVPVQRARRDRIVRTALRMLDEGDYDDIQMRDVAEQADVAIGTLYRYFESKEHLFAAVLLVWSDSLGQRILRQPLKSTTPAGRLDELLGRVISAFEKKPQFLRMLIVVEASPDQYARALHQKFGATAMGIFHQPLSDLEDKDAEAILDVVQGVMGAMLRVWAVGLMPMKAVRERLSRTIDLVFSPPPKPRRRRAIS